MKFELQRLVQHILFSINQNKSLDFKTEIQYHKIIEWLGKDLKNYPVPTSSYLTILYLTGLSPPHTNKKNIQMLFNLNFLPFPITAYKGDSYYLFSPPHRLFFTLDSISFALTEAASKTTHKTAFLPVTSQSNITYAGKGVLCLADRRHLQDCAK